MPSPWPGFVPYPLLAGLLEQELSPGSLVRFEAAGLFADISGFTAMSEALRIAGRSGAEELTDLLNRYFAPMIELIQSYGGIIARFGGDAMTVLFPCQPENRAAAHRAVQCALEMQARMGDYADLPTSAGVFSLTMKAGLAFGPALCTIVGDPGVRLETIAAGSVLDRCAEAEHHAMRGEVVAHRSLLQICDQIGESEARGDFSRLFSLKSQAPLFPLPPLADPGRKVNQSLRAFVHPSIAHRVDDGQTSFIDEHRKVTTLFVAFEGFDYDHDPQVGEKLQTYLTQVIHAIQHYDGYLNKVDMGDKGSKLVALFGAPIAHENDAERGLRCALELAALSSAPLRIGITTGFVFCGQVGSAERREYAVMGDVVNLAARLMQAAQPGEIWVADTTHDDTPQRFIWGERNVIRVKGKSEAVGVRLLRGVQRQGMRLQELEYPLPMVGRENEMTVIAERLARAQKGQGQILGITAEAGMGKSRLSAEVFRLATGRGLTAYGGECLSHGANTPYLVWQNLLRGFFALDPDQPLAVQQQELEAELAQVSPALARRAPLLALPLNLPIPENAVTRTLDARLRKESLEALLVACIRRRAAETPLLLIFEDCHWIDALSNDLLETVGRNIADLPVLILVVYRPAADEHTAPRVTRFAHFSEIRLAEFTSEEARRLIELKLTHLFGAGSALSGELAGRINEKAQGNPFYIDEIINLIHDRGLNPNDTQALLALELPGSLHSLIISRMDQLAEDTKTTLKVASVIGRSFKASWLWGVYPNLGTPDEVKGHLAQLSRLDITPLDKPEPELEFLFKHIVTREVAYESLAVATRAMLHENTGRFIEQIYADETARNLDLLAHHYGLSHNTAKQRVYFQQAADAARAAYANEAAIRYYQRLLPLLAEPEKPAALLDMGRVLQLVGRWDEAEEAYTQARQFSEAAQDTLALARARLAAGALCRYQGDFPLALSWLDQAHALFESNQQLQGVLDCLKEIGIVHWSQGAYPEAMTRFQQCRALAEEQGNRRALYQAIGNMGLIYEMDGELDRAMECHASGRQIAQEIGDRVGESIAVGNMGNIYLERGDYPNALACYSQNLHIAVELGYRLGVSIAVGNLGNVYWWRGDFAQALTCQTMNLQIALEMGDWMGVSRALWSIAGTWAEEGRHPEAASLLDEAIRIARALDTPDDLCEFLRSKAELLARQGDRLAAQSANREALGLAQQVENKDVEYKSRLLGFVLQARLGQASTDGVIAAISSLNTEATSDVEKAAARYEIWSLDPTQETERAVAAGLYRALYQHTPSFEYRRRYRALAGETLPEPPPLPPLPEIVTRQAIDLPKLLAQAQSALREIG